MKKKTQLPTTYKFWKENRKDGEYTLAIEEIRVKYLEWLKTKEIDWIMYYGHSTVIYFVTDQTGLNSVVERGSLRLLENELMETRRTLYPEREKQSQNKK